MKYFFHEIYNNMDQDLGQGEEMFLPDEYELMQ